VVPEFANALDLFGDYRRKVAVVVHERAVYVYGNQPTFFSR
jgi:hypothetical protein